MGTFTLSKHAEEARGTRLKALTPCLIQKLPNELIICICSHLSIDDIRTLKQTCRLYWGTLDANAVRRSHGRVHHGRVYYRGDEDDEEDDGDGNGSGDQASKRCRICLRLFLSRDGLVWTAATDFEKPLRAVCWGCASAHGLTRSYLRHLYFRDALPALCEYCHVPSTSARNRSDHNALCARQRRLENAFKYFQLVRTLPLTVATFMSIADGGLPGSVKAPLWVSLFYWQVVSVVASLY